MSRSKRKTPITGNCGRTEKYDKRICNRKLRRRAKELLNLDHENYLDPLQEEVMDVWSMSKDGKSYTSSLDLKKWQFFSLEDYKKMMRK